MKFHSDKDKQGFINNCKAACNGLSAIAKYKGCFNERPSMLKEFKVLLGEDITPRECFDLAKENKHRYVALTYGSKCYSNDAYGQYGKIDDKNCNMVCSANDEVKCGGNYANSVYDVKDYVHSVDC